MKKLLIGLVCLVSLSAFGVDVPDFHNREYVNLGEKCEYTFWKEDILFTGEPGVRFRFDDYSRGETASYDENVFYQHWTKFTFPTSLLPLKEDLDTTYRIAQNIIHVQYADGTLTLNWEIQGSKDEVMVLKVDPELTNISGFKMYYKGFFGNTKYIDCGE